MTLTEKKLHLISITLVGNGYKAEEKEYDGEGKVLSLDLGYSHPILLKIPKNIQISLKKEKVPALGIGESQRIFLESHNIYELSNYAQMIKSFRRPDSYKGKGVVIHKKKDLLRLQNYRKERKGKK